MLYSKYFLLIFFYGKFLFIENHLLVVWIDEWDMGNEPWDPNEDSSNNGARGSHRQVAENNQTASHR
jgi:hypothetical protein